MDRLPLIVGVSGSVTRPSRTTALVSLIVDSVMEKVDAEASIIELAEAAPHLLGALTREHLSERARSILELVESADLLVVGTPVYRASMTGALKHLFDLVDQRAFTGKPVVLTATGGSLIHGLVPEYQMRPLFAFLNALSLPTTIYAVEADFDDYRVTTASVRDRAERAAVEAATQLRRASSPLLHKVGVPSPA